MAKNFKYRKKFEISEEQKKANWADYELSYVNRGFVLDFFHIPTGNSVIFKAMLTDFKDAYESEWNSESVYGRMDPIETFQNTKRKITLAWDVVSADAEEAIQNMKRASLLLSMLYPVYTMNVDLASTMASAPLFKLKFANLIQEVGNSSFEGEGGAESSGLVGRVDGFTYAPNLEYGMFEKDSRLYPQTLAFNCTYFVQHTHQLGWDRNGLLREGQFPYDEDFDTKDYEQAVFDDSHDFIEDNDALNESNQNDIFQSYKKV